MLATAIAAVAAATVAAVATIEAGVTELGVMIAIAEVEDDILLHLIFAIT